MTNTNDYDMHDAILLLSTPEAGREDINGFLSLENTNLGKRCRLKIMKRIRHSDFYRDGRMSTKAAIMATVMLTMLALLFVAVGFVAAKLTMQITEAEDKKQLFSIAPKEELEKVYEITDFKKPSLAGANVQVLSKSSRFYNVRYTTDDGSTLYYSQLPKRAEKSEKANIAENSKAQLFVLVNGNPGEVYITKNNQEKSFELCWSDDEYTYSVYPAQSIEQAVMFAHSIYE